MSNAALVNFAGGETSPKSRGRFDIGGYPSSCRKMRNFFAEVQGPARFRTGFRKRLDVLGNVAGVMVPFQVNSSLGYMLEFTPGKVRAIRNHVAVATVDTPYYTYEDLLDLSVTHNGTLIQLTHWKYAPRILLMTALDTFSLITPPRVNDPFGVTAVERDKTTVSGVSRAPKAVVTVGDATGIDGSWGYITGVVGLTEINYRLVKFKLLSSLQFYLLDPFTGEYISTTGAAQAWSSGGAVHLLTVGAYNDACNIVDIHLGTTTYVTFPVGTVRSTGDLANLYYFDGLGGTTELNGKLYSLTNMSDDAQGRPRSLVRTVGNNDVDSSTWGAYTGGGYCTRNRDLPGAAAFHETRLVYGGTSIRPGTIFGSRATGDLGDDRFNDFTGGTNDDDAYFFTPSPVDGAPTEILWLRSSAKFLLVGALGGVLRMSGAGLDEAISPNSVVVRQVDNRGGIYNDAPVVDGAKAFFIQRGGRALRGLRYNISIDELEGYDVGLGAEHIAQEEGIRKIAFQAGATDVIWVLRNDGELAAVTVNSGENITGWHRHRIGGTDAKVLDVAVMPRSGEADELWILTSRTINGSTAYFLETLTDEVTFPDLEDFFTGAANRISDRTRFRAALYSRQEDFVFMDAASSYYGDDRGVADSVTITLGSYTGTGVSFAVSSDIFTAGDVGSEIWVKPDRTTGQGAGRAVIKSIHVGYILVDIEVDFKDRNGANATSLAPGEWYIAVDAISGLDYLEGEHVAVLYDGAVYADGKTGAYTSVVVTAGAIELDKAAAVVHVGLPYEGVLETQNLELGGRSGPAQAKPRNICGLNIRFLNTMGGEYGTERYATQEIVDRDNTMDTDRPVPPFSGVRKLQYSDNWSGNDSNNEKRVVIVQQLPLPCIVQFVDIEFDTSDEG